MWVPSKEWMADDVKKRREKVRREEKRKQRKGGMRGKGSQLCHTTTGRNTELVPGVGWSPWLWITTV